MGSENPRREGGEGLSVNLAGDAASSTTTPFQINGTTPFAVYEAGEYIRAAHAVACLCEANGGDASEFYSTSPLLKAGFGAIALLLAHAAQLDEGVRR
jgi:hypothetical protein